MLCALAVPSADAGLQANLLVEADLRGFPSHGIQRLPVIVERIRNGLALPRATPVLRWRTEAVLEVDGGRGLGPVVAERTMTALRDRAQTTGVALGLVSNCNHLGMLAWYAERAAQRGDVCVVLTTSEALVHASGGRRALIGTNPIAIGIPAEPAPFVLDMATGTVSMGRIIEYARRGDPIPGGWALDEDGRPTTDALAASRGAISPFGGPKGYGLGLAFELLVGALTGTALGTDVSGTLDTTAVCNKGDLFLYISPTVLGIDSLGARITPYLDEIRCSGAGPDAVRTPGQRSRALRERRLVEGIPLTATVWGEALELKRELVAEHVRG